MTVKMDNITARQKKVIHTITHAMAMDDASYRGLLERWFGARTCTALTFAQADLLIRRLSYIAEKVGTWQNRDAYRTRYNELGIRPGMATPAQLRMIEAMWHTVSYQEGDEAKERALNRFLLAHFRVSSLRWLEDWQAQKVIKTLGAMLESQKGKKLYRVRRRTA